MKRIFTLFSLLALSIVFASTSASAQQTQLAKWTFEAVDFATTGSTTPVITTGTAMADSGLFAASSTFTGQHASASTVWSTPAGNGSANALSSNNWAPGDYYQFQTSTLGFSGVTVMYSQTGSSTGPKTYQLQYSTDGVNFTNFGSPYDISGTTFSGTTFKPEVEDTFDLSAITSLNNAPTVYFRVAVAPGSTAINGSAIATGGTGRIDDFTVLASTVLPIRVASFNATLAAEGVNVSWNTASEVNAASFTIERSFDGKNFEAVGQVEAKNTAASYNYYDVDSVKGTVYYRLKMVDKDGSFTYSLVASVSNKSSVGISAFPNPTTDRLVLNYTKAEKGAVVEIFTLAGERVSRQAIAAGSVQTELNVSNLAKGTYLLIMQNGSERTTTKVVKL